MSSPRQTTKSRILSSALKIFARYGYSGASIQDIVDDAKVTKPTLYYYFKSKAGLFEALVHQALNERYRLLFESTQSVAPFEAQLVAILNSTFEFTKRNKDLMRLSFFTAFAPPEEIPPEVQYVSKFRKILKLIQDLMERALKAKTLRHEFTASELAIAFHGHINIYVMSYVISQEFELNDEVARRVARLFLVGAARST
jgi:AcrR family transcriptional regulator